MATINFELDGDIGVITLDNGELNLFGPDAFDSLDTAIDQLEESGARAAVWRAEGEIFSGGVDVHVFSDAVEKGEGFPSLMGPSKRLESLPIPTLALCHGLCLTAGLEIALACDML